MSEASRTTNRAGFEKADYTGAKSTLCLGCGHDQITRHIIAATYESGVDPYNVAKTSGIGCSSKTGAYFINKGYGINAVHGRMPSVATGASMANRHLVILGVSGDGDTASIGLGQFMHAVRRNTNKTNIVENNGVYGLTKGQFSASADIGSKSKRGEPNLQGPIDPVPLALAVGATFVARSFSGDKEQLVPILKAGIAHRGFAFVDVISPCVTFNDHEGSTKSYAYTRERNLEVVQTDFVPLRAAITAEYEQGAVTAVTMHDGSVVRLRKVAEDYDPSDREAVLAYLRERQEVGEVATGLLYLDEAGHDFHDMSGTVDTPLVDLPYEQLCPGAAALEELQERFR